VSIVVDLTPEEVEFAASIGVRRQLEAYRKGLANVAGLRFVGWDEHIEGAAGELAVAKLLGRHWDATVNTFKFTGDVGPELEVRTRSKHHYDLLVRPNDNPYRYYCLVTGTTTEGAFRVHGWLQGRECMQDCYRQTYADRPVAWFVPQSALNQFRLKEQ
jgi:hypothetical protein